MTIQTISIKLIDPSPEPIRSEWSEDEMQSLADSIKTHGLLQPPAVRTADAGRYEIVYGHRRVEACRRAKFKNVDAIVLEASDEQALELSLIENIQREDMIPRDKAIALSRLMEMRKLSSATAVEKAGIMPRKSAAVLLKLLDQPEDVQEMVGVDSGGRGEDRKTKPLTMEHISRTSIAGPNQDKVLRKAAREGLTALQAWDVAKVVSVAAENQDETRVEALLVTYEYSPKVHNEAREKDRYQPRLVPEIVNGGGLSNDVLEESELEDDTAYGDAGPISEFDRLRSLVSVLRINFSTITMGISAVLNDLSEEEKEVLSTSLGDIAQSISEFSQKGLRPSG